MNTICKNCVFREVKDGAQTGCSFHDRLEVFKERGKAELIDWDGQPYYQISSLCNACTQPSSTPHTVEYMREVVERQIAVNNIFVLPVSEPNDDAIDHFAEVALKQSPVVKTLIAFGPDITKEYYISIIARYPHIDMTQLLLDEDLRQFAISKAKGQFITLFEPGMVIPADFNEKFNRLFNYELQRFLSIRPKTGYHGLVVLDHVAKYLPLKKIITLEKNILEWADWNQRSL